MKIKIEKVLSLLLGALLLSACTATTSLQTSGDDVQLRVNHYAPVTLSSETGEKTVLTYPTTSFGQFKFKLTQPGVDPVYGLIPLKFNGGYLAADILFFAPAMLYNLREVFPFYEFDGVKGVVRYKKQASDHWIEYKPTPEEADHARHFFGDL